MTREGGGGEAKNLTYTTNPLGLLGLPWSNLTEKAWNQTLTHLRLPDLKIGDGQHTIPAISLRKLSDRRNFALTKGKDLAKTRLILEQPLTPVLR